MEANRSGIARCLHTRCPSPTDRDPAVGRGMRVGDTDTRNAPAVQCADGEPVPIEDDGVTELGKTLESVQQKTRHRVVRTCGQRYSPVRDSKSSARSKPSTR